MSYRGICSVWSAKTSPPPRSTNCSSLSARFDVRGGRRKGTLWQPRPTFTRDWPQFCISIVQKMGQLSGRFSSSRGTRPISTLPPKLYLHPKKRMAAETIGTELLYGIPANSGGRLAIRSA
jgi:hypothetical protein